MSVLFLLLRTLDNIKTAHCSYICVCMSVCDCMAVYVCTPVCPSIYRNKYNDTVYRNCYFLKTVLLIYKSHSIFLCDRDLGMFSMDI